MYSVVWVATVCTDCLLLLVCINIDAQPQLALDSNLSLYSQLQMSATLSVCAAQPFAEC